MKIDANLKNKKQKKNTLPNISQALQAYYQYDRLDEQPNTCMP